MADKDEKEMSLDQEGDKKGGKKKLIIIIVAVVLLLGGGAAAYFLLFSGDSSDAPTEQSTEQADAGKGDVASVSATYVAMPRPFVFNVMDGKRDRLVQIKVQLLVRGNENESLAKKHIPLLEGALVRVFGAATVSQLRNPEGKDQIREQALAELNKETKKLEGKELIDTVLFTGFVLQ
tara:strand:+ start:27443 stop:27976 length:534 start_codon:yes stop_codon:yes gene_type:complete